MIGNCWVNFASRWNNNATDKSRLNNIFFSSSKFFGVCVCVFVFAPKLFKASSSKGILNDLASSVLSIEIEFKQTLSRFGGRFMVYKLTSTSLKNRTVSATILIKSVTSWTHLERIQYEVKKTFVKSSFVKCKESSELSRCVCVH